MFYSHEVLTSRKHGVATVWLVATLGSKSNLKRVSRKAILDVDVEKACETIIEPDAPMALRLQGNLLYGVARVYSQQCGYVLTDAESAKNSMRAMFKVMQTSGLEAEGHHKGRPDQLVLQDDPNFLPDFDLLPLDLNQLNLEVTTTTAEESQRSTLSSHNSQAPAVGIDIPGPSSSAMGGPVGGLGGSFGVRGDHGSGRKVAGPSLLEDDVGLIVDADGSISFGDPASTQAVAPAGHVGRAEPGSASSRVRREHEGGQLGGVVPGQLDDDGFVPLQDDYLPGTDAEGFPLPAADGQPQQHTTSESADAPMRRRARAAPKVIAPDATLELRNSDLARWNTDYAANMQEAAKHKQTLRATTIAKENAKHWVLGSNSLASLGQSDRSVQGPLDMFYGAKLLQALTGVDLTAGGEKRSREEDGNEQGERRVRSRGPEGSSHEIGRGGYDDGYMPIIEDDFTAAVEQGREAPTPLDDRHLSSAFPWNHSTGSRRPTGVFGSASILATGVPPGVASRRGSRLQTASPLVGRGLPGNDTDELQLGFPSDQIGDIAMEDFELYGPGAEVDTQTAGQSQWVRAALDGESSNFHDFVKAGIQEADQKREEAGMGEEEDERLMGSIDFDGLLPPKSNSCVVAAQALLHVLTLGTKNLLQVEQEEAFGAITLRDAVV